MDGVCVGTGGGVLGTYRRPAEYLESIGKDARVWKKLRQYEYPRCVLREGLPCTESVCGGECAPDSSYEGSPCIVTYLKRQEHCVIPEVSSTSISDHSLPISDHSLQVSCSDTVEDRAVIMFQPSFFKGVKRRGERVTLRCPAGCADLLAKALGSSAGKVIGSAVYSYDTLYCAGAVHAGG